MGRALFSGGKIGMIAPGPSIAEGTIWLFTEDGEFTVPVTGTYSLELHGGGGGGGYSLSSSTDPDSSGIIYTDWTGGGSGGGSGELFEVQLTEGDVLPVTIGVGGEAGYCPTINTVKDGASGGETSIGSYSIAGGGGGPSFGSDTTTGGAASGSIATSGLGGVNGTNLDTTVTTRKGGYGNKNNTAQTYGNGGNAGPWNSGHDGQPGAVIITYLGKEAS